LFELLRKKLGNFAEKVKKKIEQKADAEGEISQGFLQQQKGFAAPEQPEKNLIEEKQKEALPKLEETPELELPAEEEAIAETGEEEPAAELLEEKAPIEERAFAEGKFSPGFLPAGKKAVAEKKRELKPAVSIKGKLKAAITGAVTLKESDLKGLLWELELALLEADVEQTTAEEICRLIKEKLSGKIISRKENAEAVVKKEIREALLGMMKAKEIDLLQEIKAKKEKPYRILFLGPNGSGKTTSIAKLTWLLQSKGLKVIWAASDTFRAASIEQLEKHAERLNARVVKHQYGADPAAVAFDAVKAAQGKGIEVVLIDSAGRQETNRNLMGELQKIVRVAQPDLKIYVGEAYTGQALLQQAKEYDKMIGIDAFILTKIDCDAKGGTTISLLFKLQKPILFIGTGQEYRDLQRFEPEFVINKIIG